MTEIEDKKELEKRFKYEFAYWIPTLGSSPKKLIESEDNSRSYEMNAFHIFKLENGKYATVYESGCSCYTANDAQIEIQPDLKTARKQMEEWRKRGY